MTINLQSSCNPIIKHWHGRYSLIVTIVVVLLGLRLLLIVSQPFVQEPVNNLLLGGWATFCLLVLVWQVVGGWRACDQFLRNGGDSIAGYAGYLAIPVTCILALVQFFDGAAAHTEPVSVPVAVIADLPLLEDGTSIVIRGPVDWNTHTQLTKTLENNPSINTVVLDSEGGWVFAARGLALLISQYELDTHIDGRCYSACSVVFLAGTQRTMSPDARLGFHQYSMAKASQQHLLDVTEQLQRDRDYFISRGISQSFVDGVFVADSNHLWRPQQTLLRDSGVLTND